MHAKDSKLKINIWEPPFNFSPDLIGADLKQIKWFMSSSWLDISIFSWCKKVNELESGDENILNAKSVSSRSNLRDGNFPSELLHSMVSTIT